MEKFLLKNITPVLFTFAGVIFFVWLFQYLNFSFSNPIQIPFLKEVNFEGIISTQYILTTIGAIFAFWYGYKKYEIEKEIEQVNLVDTNIPDDIDKKILYLILKKDAFKKGFLNKNVYHDIEKRIIESIKNNDLKADLLVHLVRYAPDSIFILDLINHGYEKKYGR